MGRFTEVIRNTDYSQKPDFSKDPDRYAQDIDNAKQTGLPVDYVERNRDKVENIKKRDIDFAKYTDTALGKSLSDSTFSNLAQDDLDNLSYVEKIFKGLGTQIYESFEQMGAGKMLAAEDALIREGVVTDNGTKDRWIEEIQKSSERVSNATPEGMDMLQKGIRSGLHSLALMAPGFAATVASKNPAPMLTSAGIQTYYDSYATARSGGLDSDTSALYASIDSSVEVATELLPAEGIVKLTSGVGNKTLKEAIRWLITEGATEQVATFLQSANAYAFDLDEELANAETLEEKAKIQAERQAITFISTVVAGGAQAGVAAGIGKLSGNKELDELKEAAEQSNLKRRSPDQFRSFLQEVDPERNIFIPASALEGIEISPDNPTLEKVQQQYQSAKALNGDIVVPVSDVITDIPADVFNKLSPYMRVEEDGVADIQKPEIKDLIEKVNREADIANESKAFQEQLAKQISDTGRQTPAESKKYAAVIGARLETIAIKEGMALQEVIDTYAPGLRVVGPDADVQSGAILDQAQKEGYEGNDPGEAMEWVRAKEKGLDMSKEARMERAKAMGFDVESVYTHESPSSEAIKEINRGGKFNGIFSLEGERAGYYQNTQDFIVRGGVADNSDLEAAIFDDDGDLNEWIKSRHKGADLSDDEISEILDYAATGDSWPLEGSERWERMSDIFSAVDTSDMYVEMQKLRAELAERLGYAAVTQEDEFGNSIQLLPGSKVRSINAAFDPDYKDSPNLLAQSAYHGTPPSEQMSSIISDDKYERYAIRVLPDDMPSKAGDILENSYRWDDGVNTTEELNGTSGLLVTAGTVKKVLRDAGAGGKHNNTFSGYHGKSVALIASNRYSHGEDPGEVVLMSPVVLAVFEKEENTIGPGGGLIGESANDDLRQAELYEQKERGLISISDNEIIIKLTEASDHSTFIHEAGHLFLEIETRIAKKNGVSEDQQKLLEWLGVDSFDDITTEQHEKFARGFEAYAMEGKAPSKGLVEVFRSFSRWLKKVYSSLRSLNVELNDDIRQFFDRMLATDLAIKEAENLHQYDALFKDAKSAGMTEAEYKEYQDNVRKASDKADEDLQSKLLKELTRQTEKWWKDELKQEKRKAMDVIDQQPVYRAILFMNGKLDLEGVDNSKMDTAAVKEILGDGKMPNQLRGLTVKGGMHPDEMAALFDFASGHELVNTIATSPTLKEAVNSLAEQAMVEKHGDILNDGTLQEEATLAAHNEERGKAILSELRALNKKQGKDTINRDALRYSARDVISRTPLKDIHPGKYRTAEVRNAKEAATAQAKGDTEAAAQAKLKQAANFYLYREAMDAKKKEESWRRYLSSVKSRKYSTKEVNPDYVRTIKMLSSVYDFRKNPNGAELLGIAQWIKAQQEAKDADVTPQILDVHLSEALRAAEAGEQYSPPHYRDMTLDELQGVYDMVKHLRWVGGQLSENEKLRLKRIYEATADSIRERGGKVLDDPRENKAFGKIKSEVKRFGQDHLAIINHILELDGFEYFGEAFNTLYSDIIKSTNKELQLRREASEKMREAFKLFGSSDFAEGKGERTIVTEDGRDFTLSRRGRLMLGLYWGSPESRQAIMDGDNLTVSDVNQMLDHLTDKELDLIESIWSINESFWPELAQVAKTMTGIVPAKVEHKPYGVRGRIMRGGYMRLFYDYDKRDSKTLTENSEKETRSGERIVKQTKHGSRNERVGSGGRKVSLDVSNIFKAMDEVIHDISFAETGRNISRAMKSDIADAIIDHYGKEKYESMMSAMSGVIAGGFSSNQGLINMLFRHFRTAATYSMLGYSVRNAAQQPIALTNLFGRIGTTQVLSAMTQMATNPNKTVEFVRDRSEFMRNRTALVNREIAEAMNKVGGNVLTSRLKQHAFDLQTIGDSLVAYPGWIAAYNKGISDFKTEEKAIIYADETISATIGSGLMKDMSPLLQGGGSVGQTVGPELLKSITFMGSYFNVVGRLIRDAHKELNIKSPSSWAKYSSQMTWYLFAPAILGAFVVGGGPDDDESYAEWFVTESAKYGLSSIFGIRDMVSVFSGYGLSNSYTRSAESIYRLWSAGVKVAEGDSDLSDMELQAKMLRSASYLYPIPGAGSFARTWEYIGSQNAGNEGDFNIYYALVVGKDRD